MSSRMVLFAGLVALALGLAGYSATVAWGTASSASRGEMMGGGMMAGGMMSGMAAEPMMVWRQGSGAVASPQDAARLGLGTVQGRGWSWLTLDEVHIFPTFYEVEFNDGNGLKGPEVYVGRTSGAVGPEMGPNTMWDTQYGMGAGCSATMSEGQARSMVTTPAGLSLGDGEHHHGYWEFELKRANKVVNQVNVNECGHGIINEQMWQADMEGTYAPPG